MPPVTVSGRSSGEPELAGLHLHGGGEAAVDVEVGDVVEVDAGELEQRARPASAVPGERSIEPGRAAGSSPATRPRRPGTPTGRGARRPRSAASTEVSSSAAPWSTFHCEHSRFVYGEAIIRLSADGVGDVVGARARTGPRPSGLAAATRAKPAHSAPSRSRCCSADEAVDVAQHALDQRVLVGGHGQVALDLDAR